MRAGRDQRAWSGAGAAARRSACPASGSARTSSTAPSPAAAPNRLWVADITYLRTWEGWLYLVAVQDLYSRRIVGWSMADHMRTELVTDALQMALAQRRPAPGLIWHSDQGSQFVSLAFGQQARAAGIAQSMGSRGDCYDNAVAESFFATLKKELVHRRSWPTKAELRTEIFDYIEVFYNRRRRHSTLGMLSPADYENSNSRARRDESRRFAARIHPHDQVHCTNRECPRLINPCPPKRGNSNRPFPKAHRGDLAHAHPQPALRSGRRRFSSSRLTALFGNAPPERASHFARSSTLKRR